MAALPDLITVEQFRQLPEGGELTYELHHGEVVALTRPKARHERLQLQLRRLLERNLKSFGEVTTEMAYRAVAEFDLRAADIAVVSWERWKAADLDDNLRGAPDLMIEVLSPSNTRRQLQELVTLCLLNGSVECWLVDPWKQSVTVFTRGAASAVYSSGASVPLARFGAGDLAIDEIFA
jgi:Uma2 family endonuclease